VLEPISMLERNMEAYTINGFAAARPFSD